MGIITLCSHRPLCPLNSEVADDPKFPVPRLKDARREQVTFCCSSIYIFNYK